jgi:hypothetical protein
MVEIRVSSKLAAYDRCIFYVILVLSFKKVELAEKLIIRAKEV